MNYQPPHWVVVHLYADEPWETLLGLGIRPIVQETLTSGLSEQFFFCRSWARRPHLKLYFASGPGPRLTSLQLRLERYFRHDFAHRLLTDDHSDRLTYTLDFATVATPAILAANTAAPAALSVRYCGLLSQVLLDLFAQNTPWRDAHGLTAAIQLHLGLAWALGLDGATTSAFYRSAGALWAGNAVHPVAENHRPTARRFAAYLRAQQHKLHSYGRALWAALQLAAPFEEPWFRQWLHALPIMRQEVQPLPTTSTCDPQQWAALAAHTHLIHNQLGIVAQEEVLLGQLLADALAVPLPLSTTDP